MSVTIRDCVDAKEIRRAPVRYYDGVGSARCADGCGETFPTGTRYRLVGERKVCEPCWRCLRERVDAERCP